MLSVPPCVSLLPFKLLSVYLLAILCVCSCPAVGSSVCVHAPCVCRLLSVMQALVDNADQSVKKRTSSSLAAVFSAKVTYVKVFRGWEQYADVRVSSQLVLCVAVPLACCGCVGACVVCGSLLMCVCVCVISVQRARIAMENMVMGLFLKRFLTRALLAWHFVAAQVTLLALRCLCDSACSVRMVVSMSACVCVWVCVLCRNTCVCVSLSCTCAEGRRRGSSVRCRVVVSPLPPRVCPCPHSSPVPCVCEFVCAFPLTVDSTTSRVYSHICACVKEGEYAARLIWWGENHRAERGHTEKHFAAGWQHVPHT